MSLYRSEDKSSTLCSGKLVTPLLRVTNLPEHNVDDLSSERSKLINYPSMVVNYVLTALFRVAAECNTSISFVLITMTH